MPSSRRIGWIDAEAMPGAAKLVERVARLLAPKLIGAPIEYLDLEDRAVLRAFAYRQVTKWASSSAEPMMARVPGDEVRIVPVDGEVVDGEVVDDAPPRARAHWDPYSLDRRVRINGVATKKAILDAPRSGVREGSVFVVLGGMLVQLDRVEVVIEPW